MYTKLPYKSTLEGKPDSAAYTICIAHPPEKLSQNDVREAIRAIRSDPVDQFLRRMAANNPDHSVDDCATKLAAISALAGANGRNILAVAKSSLSWLDDNNLTMSSLIKNGTWAEATAMMEETAEDVGHRSTSLLSKYLAYHNPRWMIYDSYVRAYVFAMHKGLPNVHARGRRPSASNLHVKSFRSLQKYSNYCSAVDLVWRQLGLKAPRTARDKEGVFWHRAKNCQIYEW